MRGLCAILLLLSLPGLVLARTNPYILGAEEGAAAPPAPDPVVCTTQTTTATGSPTYTQDITCAGIGTPKAAIFLVSHATANDTAVAHAKWAWGLTDGTRSKHVGTHGEDGQGTSDEYSSVSLVNLFSILTTGTGGDTGKATFNSWITDGIRINWTESPGAGYRMIVIFFGGDDIVNAYVNHVLGSGSDGGSVDVTDPGFEPDVVFGLTLGSASTETVSINGSQLGAGWAWRDGSDTNRGTRYGAQDAQATTTTTVGLQTDAMAVADFGGGFELGVLQIGSFDSQGFTLTTVDANGGGDILIYLALDFAATRNIWVGDFLTKTSTGDESTTIGFEPNHLSIFCNYMTSIGVHTSSADSTSAGSQMFGAGEIGSEFSSGYVNQDNVGTSDTYSYANDKIIGLRNEDTGAALVEGSFSAVTSTQFTINYTVADTTARQCIGFAVE
jgi:hypothetical protein